MVPPAHGIVAGPRPVKKKKNTNGTDTPVITSFLETFRFWDVGIIGLILLASHARPNTATTHPIKADAGASYGKAAKTRSPARTTTDRKNHHRLSDSPACDLSA